MRRLYPILAILALTALPLFSQTKAPAKAPANATANPQPKLGPPPLQVEQAARMHQGGDLKGAIALLEPLKAQKGVHPAALSLLGTLYLEAGRPADSLALLGPLADSGAAGPVILQTAARAALAAGQKDKAVTYLRKAVEKAPGSPAARDLGLLRGSEGQIEESYLLLLPWATAHPDDQEARLAAAYGAIELDRPPDAGKLLAGLPEENPRVRLLRARLQLLQKEPRKAIATLEPLLKSAPPDLDLNVRRYLSEAYLAIGESAEAIKLLQGKVGSDPSLALLLARAQYQAGNPTEAVALLKPLVPETLTGEPATSTQRRFVADFAVEYGQATVATSDWSEAILALQKATRLDPKNLKAWQLLGRALLASGRREDANQAMARFQELQSAQKSNSQQVNEAERGGSDPTGRNLEEARGLAAAGRTDEALVQIRQEIALVPSDPRPRAAEVTTLLIAKKPQEALKAAENALSASPGNPDFLYLRGAVRMAVRDLPAAEKDFRQALQARPDHVAALSDLAVLLIANGRKDEARGLLRKVLEIKPGDPTATANLKSLGGA
ncbi:MAG TPA: tetratricopeptide repeat protein [Thermoanaerobaculia bacterium]|nr:tetratricopeptide repeat protein [Thermoanaerobaculia bacterium]